MSLLVILGIWIAASAALTPLVGFFLSGRASGRRARDEVEAGLQHRTQPPL